MSNFNINDNPQGVGAIPWLIQGLKILWRRVTGIGQNTGNNSTLVISSFNAVGDRSTVTFTHTIPDSGATLISAEIQAGADMQASAYWGYCLGNISLSGNTLSVDINKNSFPIGNSTALDLGEILTISFSYYTSAGVIVSGSGGGAVSSVFGRTGTVVSQSGDYSYSQISNTPNLSVYELSSNKVDSLSSPLPDSTHYPTTNAVNAFVNSVLSGLNSSTAVKATTTTFLPLSPVYSNGIAGVGATLIAGSNGALVVDGYTVLLNDTVLIKNQTATTGALSNGIYKLTTLGDGFTNYILTRDTSYNTPTEINAIGSVPVINGVVNPTTTWVLISHVTTIGVDGILYQQFSLTPATLALVTNTLGQFAATTSNQLRGIMSDSTGTGPLVFGTTPALGSPVMTTPILGTPSSGNLVNCTNIVPTAYTGFIDSYCFNDIASSIGNNTYTLDLYAREAFTINELRIQSASGTCNAAIQINGTSVTGLSSVAVSSSIAIGTASAANVVAVGNKITLVLSSTSSLNNLQGSLKITRS